MKQYRSILIICLFFFFSSLAFADLTLQTKIAGISGTALKNAEDRLSVLQESYGQTLTDKDVQNFYQAAAIQIQKALEPFGYFKATVTPLGLNLHQNKWTAEFNVTPGPLLLIKKVEVQLSGEGRNNAPLNQLLMDFPLKSDQPFTTESYEKAKNLLIQTANDQGYLKANLSKSEVQINLTNYSATIVLHLDTGPRYYFGPVIFNLTPFSDIFLHRFVSFKSGEPFSSQKLLEFQQNLSKSRYFKEVVVTPETAQAQHSQVPINVFLTVPKSQQYNIGAGYGTFTGARLTLGVDVRRIGDGGQHFIAQIKYSPVLKGLAAKYFIPGQNPLTDQYTIGADVQKFFPKNGQSYSENFSTSYVKSIHDWQHTLSANYLIERFQVSENPSQVSRLLYPSYTLSRIKADNLIFPRFGSAINFTLQGANQHIISSTTFVQAELKGKYIYSFSDDERFITRADFGYTVVNDLARLPLTLRFLAGGLGSVRGYPYSSIGPGRYLEVGSVEYQHKIIGNLSGAVFYDAGAATDHFNDALQRGEGVGLIYNSLIGPVEIYVARAMSTPGKPLRIEFSIGPDF